MVNTFQAKVIEGKTACLVYLPKRTIISEDLKRGSIVNITLTNTGKIEPVRIYKGKAPTVNPESTLHNPVSDAVETLGGDPNAGSQI